MTASTLQPPTLKTPHDRGWDRLECATWKVRGLRFGVVLLFACLGGGFVPCLLAGDEPSTFNGSGASVERRAENGILPSPLSPLRSSSFMDNLELSPAASVDSEGIFLHQLVASKATLPEVRLTNAPPFGQAVVWNRAQLAALLRAAAPDLNCTNWTGAATVRITRRERAFGEADLLSLLTAVLQQDFVKDKGELELRLTRPWTPRNVPDEVLALKVLELPNTGVTPSFIVRFELRTAHEILGTWQASVQAKVWREAWVARSALKRGQLVAEADLTRERRDVLTVRDTLADFAAGDPTLELAEPLQAGTPLLARSVKVRPVIRRGQFAEARVQDGALQVTLKVEALEDGAPGQTIRARNPLSRRDFTGKVLDEQTILVSL